MTLHAIWTYNPSILVDLFNSRSINLVSESNIERDIEKGDRVIIFVNTNSHLISIECKVKDVSATKLVIDTIDYAGDLSIQDLHKVAYQCKLLKNLKSLIGKKKHEDIIEYLGRIDKETYNRIKKLFKLNDKVVDELRRYIGTMSKVENLKKRIIDILEFKKQIILYGPPGTGKTYLAKEIIEHSIKQNRDKYFKDFPKSIIAVDSIRPKDELVYTATLRKYEDIQSKVSIGKSYLVYDKSEYSLIGIFECNSITTKRDKYELEFRRIRDLNIPDSDLAHILNKKLNIKDKFYDELSQEDIEKLCDYLIKKMILQSFLTFHPSYSYEEFIEGIRLVNENGNISYKVCEGIFKRVCRDAFNALLRHCGIDKQWLEEGDLPELTEEEKAKVKENLKDAPKFYLVIDEINRGDVAKIFGELITLIEADKRLFCENELKATLPYSKKRFGVPPNLYIIATMNTADKSIALIDVALRRRFGFLEIPPATTDAEWIEWLKRELINSDDSDETREIKELSVNVLKCLNDRIRRTYDKDHQIGHSYLFVLKDCKSKEETIETLKKIWYHEILPLLEEYFYDNPRKLKSILNGAFIKEDEDVISINFEECSDEAFLNKLKSILAENEWYEF